MTRKIDAPCENQKIIGKKTKIKLKWIVTMSELAWDIKDCQMFLSRKM